MEFCLFAFGLSKTSFLNYINDFRSEIRRLRVLNVVVAIYSLTNFTVVQSGSIKASVLTQATFIRLQNLLSPMFLTREE